ncbi:MAG TPA: aldehyde dehydrogenase, partial [Rhizobiales bacterium]|nr:aldehyde dehydrogenase [Hyphomicrobiales bacterium]
MDATRSTPLTGLVSDKSLICEKCYIDGEWVSSDEVLEVTNPVDGAVIATVPKLGES